MKRLAILGGGAWGTALAILLAPRFDRVRLWVRREDLALEIRAARENATYLPGITIPPNVEVTSDLSLALEKADALLSAVPSHTVRDLFSRIKPIINNNLPVISATKGLERGSHLRMSQVIGEAANVRRLAVLSGPSFAQEAATSHPTAVVVASQDPELARAFQEAFSGGSFRVYSSCDPVGVELGGAYKNVVAIGAGVCHGLGLGNNAVAALVTRGLAEMTRLAVAMGGGALTLSGLAGLGDLVLTCTGGLSRNRQLGIELAHGKTTLEIVSSRQTVAEGVNATPAIVELGLRNGVELPIAAEMNAVLNSVRSPREAIRRLMERSLREE
jgi:glycerol-3-phosphate dehydrogenase (NAD(P)+)